MIVKKFSVFLAFFAFTNMGLAAGFNFSDLTASQVDSIVEEVSPGLVYSVVSPPARKASVSVDVDSTEHDIGGIELEFESESLTEYSGSTFEMGTLYSLISIEKIGSISTGSDIDQISHASFFMSRSLFWGLGIEVVYSPPVELSGLKTERLGFALTSDVLRSILGFDLRFHFSDAKLSFDQTNPSTEVVFDALIYGATIVMGGRWSIFEPYLGIGWSKVSSQLGSTTPIFSSALTSAQFVEREVDLLEYFAGLQLNLFGFNFAFEGSQVGEVLKLSSKFSMSF